MKESVKTVVSMASIKRRKDSVKGVIESIKNQCDELHIYLNDYDEVPQFMMDEKIKIINASNGDIGDIGKFYNIQDNCYAFTIDDDIIYPHDYVASLISKIEKYNRQCCVGVHGVILNHNVNNYYKNRKCIHYRSMHNHDTGVHILGTGTLAFHTSTIKPYFSDFHAPNMADIWFAILAQKNKVGMRCVSRKAQWLIDAPGIIAGDSIYGKKTTATDQTNAINDHGKWILY
jgi:hypothetical protein